jgi:hypothetical protein
MKFDEMNTIIDNVLSEDEIQQIYDAVGRPTQKFFMGLFGQDVSDFNIPRSVYEKVLSICQELTGKDDLVIEAYQFARYQKFTREDGAVSYPRLMPHHDGVFPEPRFTFDYQIGSNTDWPLVVEGKTFTLKDNQALTFSGTHQIHWREKKEFQDGEYVDMIFFHMYSRSDKANTTDEEWQARLKQMDERQHPFALEYYDNDPEYWKHYQEDTFKK